MSVWHGKSGRNLTNQTLKFVGRIKNLFVFVSCFEFILCGDSIELRAKNGSLLKQLIHDINVEPGAIQLLLGTHWPTSIPFDNHNQSPKPSDVFILMSFLLSQINFYRHQASWFKQ